MNFKMVENKPAPVRYERIHCFTCKRDISNKGLLKRHMGHDVHYTNKSGEIDD